MRVEVSTIIDNAKINKFHLLIIAVGIFALIVDAYDLVAMGMVIPRISEHWGFDPGEFATALSLPMIGVMLGSGIAGLLGDYIGRLKTIALTVGVAGVGMALTVTADTMEHLLIFRFLTGVGAGGCIPVTIAFASEYMPASARNRLVVLMYTGAGMGSVVGGAIAPTVIEQYDWQGIFGVGAIFSVIAVLMVLLLLPESLKYLITRNAEGSKIGGLLHRVEPTFTHSPDNEYTLTEPLAENVGSPIQALFGGAQTRITLLSWVAMTGNQFMVFLLSLWLPTLFTNSGVSLDSALYLLALYNFGGVVGGLVFATFADKYGAARVLMTTFPTATVALFFVSWTLHSVPLLVVTVSLAGAFVIGSSFCLAPFVATLYPTKARSTGIGWALSVGRIGSIVSPLVGGWALDQGYETANIFVTAGIVPIICGTTIYLLNNSVKNAQKAQTIALAERAQGPRY